MHSFLRCLKHCKSLSVCERPLTWHLLFKADGKDRKFQLIPTSFSYIPQSISNRYSLLTLLFTKGSKKTETVNYKPIKPDALSTDLQDFHRHQDLD